MKDFTLVLEGEIEEDRDANELSEQDDSVGERGGEGGGEEKEGKLDFELRSIAMSSSSSLVWVKVDHIGSTKGCSCLMYPGPDHRFDCR